MLEIKLYWENSSDMETLERVLTLVRSVPDAKLVVFGPGHDSSAAPKRVVDDITRRTQVPRTRLKHIIEAVALHPPSGGPLTKARLVSLIAMAGPGTITEATASVYISSVTAAGFLRKENGGLVMTELGSDALERLRGGSDV